MFLKTLISHWLIINNHITNALSQMLQQAVETEGTEMGTLQLYDRESDALQIVSHKGFNNEFLNHFKFVRAFDSSACGRALGTGNPVVISDIMQDAGFAGHRAVAINAGYYAVKSFPLLLADASPVGVISTHYKDPLSSSDTKNLGLYAEKISKYLQHAFGYEFFKNSVISHCK